MGARVLHVEQDAGSRSCELVEVRPRYVRLVTTEQAFKASPGELLGAFRRLLAPHGTASQLARIWNVSPAFIGMIKSGERKLTDEHIAALPPHLFARFHRLVDSREPEQLSLNF